MKPHAFLYVDGSCSTRDTLGAWAAIAANVNERKLLYGVAYPTTISRCELTPIIEGLRWIKDNWMRSTGFRVLVTSDSEYTVKTLCGLNARHKNKDLWTTLDEVQRGMDVKYCWRERNTLSYMAICDAVCGTLRVKTQSLAVEIFSTPEDPGRDIAWEAPNDEEQQNVEQHDPNGSDPHSIRSIS